jgi:hypothetical protein
VSTTAGIRQAQPFDILRIVELIEQRRVQYQEYQPKFWRKAKDSSDAERAYLESIIDSPPAIVLVHEQDGAIDGVIIGMLEHLPPVYDPGGPVCIVDDFVVSSPDLWTAAGVSLLNALSREARERGAVHLTIGCGHLDRLKRTMLAVHGYAIASEWYVRDLAAEGAADRVALRARPAG